MTLVPIAVGHKSRSEGGCKFGCEGKGGERSRLLLLSPVRYVSGSGHAEGLVVFNEIYHVLSVKLAIPNEKDEA
jgi:hypothetical protein